MSVVVESDSSFLWSLPGTNADLCRWFWFSALLRYLQWWSVQQGSWWQAILLALMFLLKSPWPLLPSYWEQISWGISGPLFATVSPDRYLHIWCSSLKSTELYRETLKPAVKCAVQVCAEHTYVNLNRNVCNLLYAIKKTACCVWVLQAAGCSLDSGFIDTSIQQPLKKKKPTF